MTKGRSPNYPRLTLAEAVEKLRPVYKGIHTYPTPKEVIAQNLGYAGLSGRPLTLIGTFRRYGLLKSEGGGKLKVTDVAVAILELPAGSSQWKAALMEAAYTPDLFSDLRTEFPGELPNDATLRHNLIKKGFLPRAAEEIIRVFRANLELVEEQSGEYNAAMPTEAQPQHSVPRAEINRMLASKTAADLHALGVRIPSGDKELRFNISRETEAEVTFRGPVTQEAIEKLAALLELQKDTFPTKAELDAQAPEDENADE